MFLELSNGAESLLKEILEHRNEKGVVDAQFFFDKLDGMEYSEEEMYRSCFKELSDNELAHTHWADNGPYIITLTSTGLEYFEIKSRIKKEAQKEKWGARWHDVIVAALGALFGGVVTFLLFKLFGIG